MRKARGPVSSAFVLGLMLAALTFPPAARATANVTITSFMYDPSDASGMSLILNGANNGGMSLVDFGAALAPGSYTVSNPMLSVGGANYPTYCTAENGGPRQGVLCSFIPGLIPPGTSFTITFKVTPAYPANQANDFQADDGTGGVQSGMFNGPAPTAKAPCPAITILPPSLPTGSPGQPYMEAVSASGGTAPYTFTLGGGTPPPGVTLAPSGVLSGTPTVAGSYSFVVNVVDANNCSGSRPYTLDVFQPVVPAPCACSKISLKLDPTLLNKKGLRRDKHDFGVGFRWRMTCTSGSGNCSATITFRPPRVLAGSVPVPKQNFRLRIRRLTFTCTSPCGTSTTGRFQIRMLSRSQLNKLFGRTLAYQVVTKCGGVVKVVTVRVFIDDHGVLHRG